MSTIKKSVTLWELAIWTYARQRAHVLLKKEGQAFEWAIAATGAREDGPRPTVAWDAAMLHGTVWEVAGRDTDIADALIWPAANLKRPEPPDTTPRCWPVEISGKARYFDAAGTNRREHGRYGLKVEDESRRPSIELPPSKYPVAMERNGRGMFEGRRVEVSVKTLGFEVAYRPVYEKRGRNRWKKVDTEPFWSAIEYCPLLWDCDPGWHAAAVGAYTVWRESMAKLWDAMKGVELREHRLMPEEIAEAPPMPVLEYDSWTEGRSQFQDVEVEVSKIKRGDFGIRMFDVPTLTERRVRAAVVPA